MNTKPMQLVTEVGATSMMDVMKQLIDKMERFHAQLEKELD